MLPAWQGGDSSEVVDKLACQPRERHNPHPTTDTYPRVLKLSDNNTKMGGQQHCTAHLFAYMEYSRRKKREKFGGMENYYVICVTEFP